MEFSTCGKINPSEKAPRLHLYIQSYVNPFLAKCIQLETQIKHFAQTYTRSKIRTNRISTHYLNQNRTPQTRALEFNTFSAFRFSGKTPRRRKCPRKYLPTPGHHRLVTVSAFDGGDRVCPWQVVVYFAFSLPLVFSFGFFCTPFCACTVSIHEIVRWVSFVFIGVVRLLPFDG